MSGHSERSEPDLYFIDANVLLNVAEPNKAWMQAKSVAFLETHLEHLVISPLVSVEVNRQLTNYPEKYRGKKKVMRWLLACTSLDLEARQVLIEELGQAYTEKGWFGQPGDSDDRLHAATASVFGVPNLVTWDNRFRAQEDWIAEVNARYGLRGLALMAPDAG